MPVSRGERSRGRLLVWILGLALLLMLTGLFVATSESLRRQEHGIPFTGAVEPDLSLAPSRGERSYHDPNVAGWPVP